MAEYNLQSRAWGQTIYRLTAEDGNLFDLCVKGDNSWGKLGVILRWNVQSANYYNGVVHRLYRKVIMILQHGRGRMSALFVKFFLNLLGGPLFGQSTRSGHIVLNVFFDKLNCLQSLFWWWCVWHVYCSSSTLLSLGRWIFGNSRNIVIFCNYWNNSFIPPPSPLCENKKEMRM